MRAQFSKPNVRRFGPVSVSTVISALACGIAVICLVFFREIKAAVEVWNQSTAYSHCYLVLPMASYLLWERRGLLAGWRAKPDIRFAVVAVPLTLIWLVAERLGIMEARQLAVIAGIELLFITVLGRRFFGLIAGPLLYLFFLVPFGAFLTPALQHFTATFTVVGLDLLGIPNYSDNFTIETPAGIFFVAEACAGLRFLIAAIAFGVFYSLLSYTSFSKRLVFIAASIVTPIIANGFRALGIVVLGQVLGSAEAAAADHLIYGWLFFSVVMFLLIAGGHAFRDIGHTPSGERQAGSDTPALSAALSTAAVVVLLCIGPAVAGAIDLTLTPPNTPFTETIVAPPGCALVAPPTAQPVDRHLFTAICGRDHFDVSVHAFAARSTSGAMTSERRRVTQETGAENSAISVLDLPNDVGHWTVVQTTDPNRLTAYAGWVDGLPINNSLAGRLAQARDSILGATYKPVLITITTAEAANSPAGRRKATLERLTILLRGQTNLNSKMAEVTRSGS